MEILRILLVLVIFIAVINLSSYIRQMNDTIKKIYEILKKK